ncbi:hypothetical protein WMY93_009940 [Mugilogobius chulae]|uniref:Uncharacterized protein n=1 Tax=Mugilogobius chulae TaxID=88201 RepID=A0AAW0PHF9_9GOBI
MQEETIEAHRLVCDFVVRHGGVPKVPLTKELLNAVTSARTRYRLHLEQEREKRESLAQGEKRKAAADYLEELKKRSILLPNTEEMLDAPTPLTMSNLTLS